VTVTCDARGGPATRWYGPVLENRAFQDIARLLAGLIATASAGSSTLWLLAKFLRQIGYRPTFRGIAFNSGCARSYQRRMVDAVRHAREQSGRQIAVVGHSRGGHYANFIAAACPEDVSHVVCLGTGLDTALDVHRMTALAALVDGLLATPGSNRQTSGCLTDRCACSLQRSYRTPFPATPHLTSIYSGGDGLVRGQSCLADYATCVEVPGSHIGLAFNRHAYRAVAHTLAMPAARHEPAPSLRTCAC
jgi:triacylglycerol lipase